jgi:hypothetical protein
LQSETRRPGTMEASASFEARYAPWSDPTNQIFSEGCF